MTLRLNGSTSGYTEIDAPAVAGSNTLVLPTGAGSANQFLKNGATAGSLGWSSMVEDSSGRLLVGTSTARAFNTHNGSLQIDGDNYSESTVALIANSNDADGAYLTFAKQRSGSAGGNTVVQNNDIIGELRFNAGDGTDCDSLAGLITCRVDGTPGNNDMPGRLVFSTTADGASSPTERVRIDNNGDTYFGSTTKTGNGTCIEKSSNGGRIYIGRSTSDTVAEFHRSGTRVGQINVDTTSTAYITSSDYRLKENVTVVTDGIARLQQLKPSRFNFIINPDRTVDGFIAHEAQAVVPECATGTKDAVDADGNPIYQGIDQSKLVPLLTAALQEAIAKIETLEARLTAAGIE